MTGSIRRASHRHLAVRAAVALVSATALVLVGLVTPGAEAAGTFPFSQVSTVQFVQTDLCDMGTLGTAVSSNQAMSHASPFFVNITEVGRCISTKSLNAPPITNPENADAQIDSELFNYASVGTLTGYGTKLMANVSRITAAPFDMSVDATTGAASSGKIVASSEVFTYDSKTATSFHITARAQDGSQAADHNGGNSNANQERVHATPASGKTSSAETTLSTMITIGQTTPFTMNVSDSTAASNSCGGPPCVLVVDDERFTYDSRTGDGPGGAQDTFHITARGSTKTTAAAHSVSATVLAPREPPFELEVGDARVETGFDADSPSNAATGTSHFLCFGTETIEYNPSAAQTAGDGLSGSSDVIYVTNRGLDRIGGEECGLITPRAKEAQEHVGSSLRDATRVQLLGRALPEYDEGPVGTMALHNTSTPITAPEQVNRCISRSTSTAAAGPDTVTTRTRCYTRLINPPSPPGSEDGSGPYFVSTNALTDMFTFITQSDGTFNDETDGLVQTKLNVFALGQCIAVSSLHVEVVTKVQADKTAGDTDYGSFNIRAWLNSDTCSGTPNYIVGACDNLPLPAPQTASGSCATAADGTNLSTTPMADTTDTDRDGCTDFRELGGDNTVFPVTGESAGGQRDPFNPFDYADINHDGAISIPVDIFGVASTFGVAAKYVDYKDRGTGLGPFPWNKRAPNGSIDVSNDVFGAARQFGHACPHTHGATTYFGAHPTTLSTKITAAAAPNFLITVGTTAGFPASGGLLVDQETLTYDQTSCGAINTGMQFCVTGRGSGTPTGNTPSQHPVGAVVYPKP